MATVEQHIPPLVGGDYLTVGEFLRRWEAMPEVKKAELIGGIVYMPSPLSWEHASMENQVSCWLGFFAAHSPGCQPANNATWILSDEDSPQPDLSLRILPEYGGRSQREGRLVRGVPEFLAEVSLSSTSYDLHQKLELYETAGVQEYLVILLAENQLRWHCLENDRFQLLAASADGVYRSPTLPGLWLNGAALLEGNMAQVLATLEEGLKSPAHLEFVAFLKSRTSL